MLGDASDATPATLVVQVQERLPLGWRLCAFGTSYTVARSPAAHLLCEYRPHTCVLGTSFTVLARPPHYAALGVHMKPPPPSPFAGSLLSPMPGTLHSVAVEVGERVALGQELCVVEARKRHAALRSRAPPSDARSPDAIGDEDAKRAGRRARRRGERALRHARGHARRRPAHRRL